ncbi:Trehalose monomycolate exporter MmpL3 [Paraconexibacter sp. AEG42_29]|uniref:Trehalose monomycolate exporter MmpL3 n=1 Tax=Paraconexibacter sp. AEG42_29 TaxID=2997339 RepID=A0AAU7AS70_9ACTN
MLDRVATLTWRHPKLVLLVVAICAIGAGAVGHDVEHHLKAAGFTDSASESEVASRALHDRLGYDASPGIVFLVRPKGGGPLSSGQPTIAAEVGRIARQIASVPGVGKVDNPLTDPAAGGLRAADGRSLVLTAHLTTQDIEDEGGKIAERAESRVRSPILDVRMGGFAPGFNDVNDQTRKDLTNAELIAFPALTLLLLLVFRGVVAAAVPLLIGVLSILGTFLVLRIMSSLVDTSLFALNIATALSLGLAVDYALLMVSRYREELERDGPTREAHRRTVTSAGRTALFSGFTVAAAMAALIVMPQRFLYSVGAAGAAVGVLSAVISVLVVPSLLALLGHRINALAVRRGPSVASQSDRWYRVARAVMRRPVVVGLASAGLLLAAAAPLATTVLTGPSAEAVPPGQPSYEPSRYVQQHYPRDVTEAATIVVRGGTTPDALAALGARVKSLPGVVRATPFAQAGDVAVTNVALAGPALDSASQDTIRAVRALPGPPGTEVLVAGNTARFIDQKASLVSHAPLVVAIVAGGTLLLLFLLTGSVILPVKTLLMNALTLCATLGVMVLAFQHGWLKWLLGDSGPDSIEVTSLVFLFAVTFALSTDYAVLVISRIKEQRDAGDSNEDAVAGGIGKTGRIISAAAVMIAVVFLAFAVSPVFFMKQIAIGMAVGVLLDATIVRALLVPSLMRLLGERNWWAPAPLARFQRRFGLREGPSADAAVPDTA